jgi:molecular chaperone HtpG
MTTKHSEIKKFDAEVGKVLNLMIYSLYTNKDIFLRELISNASDACDKLRYLSITDSSLIAEGTEFKIQIKLDEKEKTISIKDNGIGMNREELIENLGTIARSGTQRFMESLSGDSKKDSQLIGQFGVGFYSSFMVAENVTVKSRKAGETVGYLWQSEGKGEYSISDALDDIEPGTEIILKIKDEEKDYLNKFTIEHIVNTYSDHISIPIFLAYDDKNEQINSASAIWLRDKKDITEEQYLEFYRGVAHMGDNPLITMHNKNEGAVNYTNLLFVPTKKPFDLYHPDRKGRVKLYVKKVFISEDQIQILPAYLRFIKGIVDSDDLPLNISRETLQNNHILEKIRRSVVKKIISELKKQCESSPEKYQEFWQVFGPVLKEGLCESLEAREPILEICLFRSALHDKDITLKEYIENMKDEQQNIYYLTGDSYEKLKNSPQLEGFLSKNLDVLLLIDQVDDFWVNVAGTYKDKEFKSVTRSDINLDEFKSESPEVEKVEDYSNLVSYIKEVLKGEIKDAIVSSKLKDSPACLAVADGAMDIRMEKFLLEQKQILGAAQKILEINPKNKIIKHLLDKVQREQKDQKSEDLIHMLYDQACLAEGLQLENPHLFRKRLNDYIEGSLG